MHTEVDDPPIELETDEGVAELIDPLSLVVEERTEMEEESEAVDEDKLVMDEDELLIT